MICVVCHEIMVDLRTFCISDPVPENAHHADCCDVFRVWVEQRVGFERLVGATEDE